ncbi:hypothetical protein GEMRC1_003636 [Eukaryota sp. GEM-RC1]
MFVPSTVTLGSRQLPPNTTASKSFHCQEPKVFSFQIIPIFHLYLLISEVSEEKAPDTESLPSFIGKVGFISQRFLETVFSAMKVFLESNTIFLIGKDLPKFSDFARGFGVEKKSVFLYEEDTFSPFELQEYASIISSLTVKSDISLVDSSFLDYSSPLYFPQLKHLSIHLSPYNNFNSFCRSLLFNSTVTDLDLNMDYIRDLIADELAEVFHNNTTLRRVSLSTRIYPENDNEFSKLISALSLNEVIQAVDISCLLLNNSRTIIPLLNSSTLQSISFPPLSEFNEVCAAILNNSSISVITFTKSSFDSSDLVNILKFCDSLKKLELRDCLCNFSPIFKSLESNTSLIELSFSNTKKSLSDEEVQSVSEMLRHNATLIELRIPGSSTSFNHFKMIIDGLETNSTLKTLIAPTLDFKSLILLYEAFASRKCNFYLDPDPHLIDVSAGVFAFSPQIPAKVSVEEVSSMTSLVERFSINQLTIKQCSFANDSMNALCDLLKSNSSLTSIDFTDCRFSDRNAMRIIDIVQSNTCLKSINISNSWFSFKSLLTILGRLSNHELLPKVDLSPHLVDVEKGVFCYSPQTYFPIFSEQMASLLAFGQSFTLRKLTLNRCQFSEESINALCDLIRLSNSLTSIDFSKCELCDEYFIQILSALQVNSHVNGLRMNLSSNLIGDSGVVALAEALKLGFHLTKLDMKTNIFQILGFTTLIDVLKQNCYLYEINFRNDSIGDEGAIVLADMLRENTTISEIDLCNASVSTEGAMKLAESLKDNSFVKTIDLRYNLVDPEIKQYIEETSGGRIMC